MKITDKWKNLPYWIRGGIIGIVIAIILSLIVILFREFDNPITFFVGLGILFVNLWFAYLINCRFESCLIANLYIFMILFIIESFLIGVIIGWVVGKIKNKK